MIRRCYVCKEIVNVDPESGIEEFKQRFEDGDPLDAVVICNKCDEEIRDEPGQDS
jgi:hypothetical protein